MISKAQKLHFWCTTCIAVLFPCCLILMKSFEHQTFQIRGCFTEWRGKVAKTSVPETAKFWKIANMQNLENLENSENIGNLLNFENLKGNADMAATAHLAVSTYIWHRLFLSGFLSISNTFDTYFSCSPLLFTAPSSFPHHL